MRLRKVSLERNLRRYEARDKEGFIDLIKSIKSKARDVVDSLPSYYLNHGFNDRDINRMTNKDASLYRLASLAKSISEFEAGKNKESESFLLTGLVKRINNLVDLKSGLSAAKRDLSEERIRVIDDFMKALRPIISFIKNQRLDSLSPFDTNVF